MPQEYGRLYTPQEANENFGEVVLLKKFRVSTILEFLTRTSEYIMFRIIDDEVIVLDEKRNTIHPEGFTVGENDVFTIYKTEILRELILKESDNEILIEQRESVLTITYGNLTLEYGAPCPPYCIPDRR